MELIKSIKWPDYFNFNFGYAPYFTSINRLGLYLQSENFYGRFLFENADSIKTSRGEHFPYSYKEAETFRSYIYEVENSNWLKQRYEYEKKHYGTSYNFGGNVEEMIKDFHHYFIPFEDDFVEVLARGFWYESNPEPITTQFLPNNPLASIEKINPTIFKENGINGHVFHNTLEEEKLLHQSFYCSQKILQFGIELNNYISISRTLYLMRDNNGNIYCSLKGSLGEEIKRFENLVGLKEIEPILVQHLKDVSERIKNKK